MKSVHALRSAPLSQWPSFEDLLKAYRACRLRKPANASQSKFERHLGKNLLDLQKAITAGTYHPKPMKCFVVKEPKPREIFAAEFCDRVVHHLVVTQIEPLWERKFIHSSFACRKGKGVHGALRHFKNQVRKISRGGRSPVWVLQMDLARFFVTIHRPTLCALLEKHAPSPELRQLIRIIYLHDGRIGAKIKSQDLHKSLIPESKSWFSQDPDRGLPIGNLTSQFGANVYLTAMDHFVQRSIKPQAYLRYMDDLLLLDRDPEMLSNAIEPLNDWIKTNRLQNFNPDKTKLVKLSDGITYLGCHAAQTGPRSEPLQFFPTGKRKWKFVRGLRRLVKMPHDPRFIKPHPMSPLLPNPSIQSELASINSLFGGLVHSESYQFRRKALSRFEHDFNPTPLPPELDPGSWPLYQMKKGYRALR